MKKTVVVGVCGGIAAYKACDLVSKLMKKNINVIVVMTKSATEFVSPLTFMTLSNNRVITKMFEETQHFDVEHISVAKLADLFVIVPATSNFIGKIANGIADDFLTTTVMATKAPVLIAPAMNSGMWSNPILQENLQKLSKLDYHFVNPVCGRLACGDTGAGKLAEVDEIIESVNALLCDKKDLSGKKVLVTAGATIEHIDPVRYITNPSSGKMGYAIARRAYERGADVTLISGQTNLKEIFGVTTIKIKSALDMYEEVMKQSEKADIIIKSAAVGDYRAAEVSENKIKKTNDNFTIELTRNPDILKELGKNKGNKILVGFSMETQNLQEYATKKLLEKNLDMIVANNLKDTGAGFGVDTNKVTIITRDGSVSDYPIMTKEEVADIILDKVLTI